MAATLCNTGAVQAGARRGLLAGGALGVVPRPAGAAAASGAAPWSRTARPSRPARRGLSCSASAAVDPAPAGLPQQGAAAAELNNVAPLPVGLVTQPSGSAAAAAPAAAAAAMDEARVAAAVAAAAAAVVALPPSVAAPPPLAPAPAPTHSTYSYDEEELVEGHAAAPTNGGLASRDDLEGLVHEALEQEIESINAAVHAAFEQEKADFELGVSQTVADAVETAVADAFLDRTFDIRANLNTMVALTGVILYWRGMWNLFDMWLGTDDLAGNVGSLLIGLSVILLFRIFKLPLAEFW